MRSKKSNPSSKVKPRRKKNTPAVLKYDGIERMSMGNSITPEYIEFLARDIIQYAKDPDDHQFTMGEFYARKNLSRQDLYSYRQKFPILEAAYREANEIIGDRRELASMGVLKKPDYSDDYYSLDNSSQVYNTLDKFCSEWKEYRDQEALRKNTENDKFVGTLKVVSEHFAPKDNDESRDGDKA